MKFSICIPNFNYARYLDLAIQSVLDQSHDDFEILVSDNASTDESVDVVRSFNDPRIHLSQNACNVGFAGNLDRAAGRATGDFLLLLSSDDLLRPNALATYARILESLEGPTDEVVLCSAAHAVDAEGNEHDVIHYDPALWSNPELASRASETAGVNVYTHDGKQLLRNCLRTMRNPFTFVTVAYPRKLYKQVEGYGGGRLLNPDKWFHWKLLGAGATPYYVDSPLFAYRWHASNQTAVQAATATLRLPVDDYVSSFEAPTAWLEQLGMTRADLERAFIDYTIARHGLALIARGQRPLARRLLNIGRACYPQHMWQSRWAWAFWTMLSLGPLATPVARNLYPIWSPRAGTALDRMSSRI